MRKARTGSRARRRISGAGSERQRRPKPARRPKLSEGQVVQVLLEGEGCAWCVAARVPPRQPVFLGYFFVDWGSMASGPSVLLLRPPGTGPTDQTTRTRSNGRIAPLEGAGIGDQGEIVGGRVASIVTDEASLLLPFPESNARSRFATLLANAKGRADFNSQLAHFNRFDPRVVNRTPRDQQSAEAIENRLLQLGAPTRCYVISERLEWDAREAELKSALDEIVGFGRGDPPGSQVLAGRPARMLEPIHVQIIREIRRRTRVIGALPDRHPALIWLAAKLRHIAATCGASGWTDGATASPTLEAANGSRECPQLRSPRSQIVSVHRQAHAWRTLTSWATRRSRVLPRVLQVRDRRLRRS